MCRSVAEQSCASCRRSLLGAVGWLLPSLAVDWFRPKLSRRQKAINRAHAKIRARGGRAIATLETWKILAELR
jgi:hypothetical protein